MFDDHALRGGVVERCAEAGIAVIAHSPLGGPRRAGRLARTRRSRPSRGRDATPAEVALAWLLDLSPPSSRSRALGDRRRRAPPRSGDARPRRGAAPSSPAATSAPRAGRARRRRAAEVGPRDGHPGSRQEPRRRGVRARGYLRLNRDERGGSLRDLAEALDEELSEGAAAIVLDNTYLTRAARSCVIETAGRHGAARCVWLDTPLAQAQVNLVERLLERFGSLPSPKSCGALEREAGLLAPTSQMRALRELEPPSADEGFADVEQVPFVRAAAGARASRRVRGRAGAERPGWEQAVARRPRRAAPPLRLEPGRRGPRPHAAARGSRRGLGPVETALCPHREARRRAGAARRSPGCRSRSRAPTTSTRRARRSSAPAPRTARSRRARRAVRARLRPRAGEALPPARRPCRGRLPLRAGNAMPSRCHRSRAARRQRLVVPLPVRADERVGGPCAALDPDARSSVDLDLLDGRAVAETSNAALDGAADHSVDGDCRARVSERDHASCTSMRAYATSPGRSSPYGRKSVTMRA